MLVLTKQVNDLIKRDSVESYPDECCGFLFGKEENEIRIILSAKPVFNVSNENKKRRFQIDPRDYMLAEKWAVENESGLLGVYHSHPDHPPIPSETDRVYAQPFFSYIILSITNGKWSNTRSWRLNENLQFDEEEIIEKIKI